MKKKTPNRMQLSRETLRNLNDDTVRKAAGAYITQYCSNTQATCYTCGADPGPDAGPQPAVFCA
jgi:hypothetical protein